LITSLKPAQGAAILDEKQTDQEKAPNHQFRLFELDLEG
jgi:hypothetical protein